MMSTVGTNMKEMNYDSSSDSDNSSSSSNNSNNTENANSTASKIVELKARKKQLKTSMAEIDTKMIDCINKALPYKNENEEKENKTAQISQLMTDIHTSGENKSRLRQLHIDRGILRNEISNNKRIIDQLEAERDTLKVQRKALKEELKSVKKRIKKLSKQSGSD